MKRFYILTILFALAVISTSAQVSKLFERYSDLKGVTSVYISKTMIGMMPDLSTNGLEFKGMADKLNSIRVLTTENASIADKMGKELDSEIKKDAYELLLSANDNGEKAVIYLKPDANGVNNYL
ncbi:MAG: DUF4252 domain-containing protein, partial [Muribaculaceae bacterium]|nr:DUF4252 domain-containing protein [Muribaculaceae bacterium]